MGHVQEHEALPDLEGGGEGVVPDHVAREAGGATKAVGVGQFAG